MLFKYTNISRWVKFFSIDNRCSHLGLQISWKGVLKSDKARDESIGLFKHYFLFEGVEEGKGMLLLTINKDDTVLYESEPIYIELEDITNMYEQYYVDGIETFSWEQINNLGHGTWPHPVV